MRSFGLPDPSYIDPDRFSHIFVDSRPASSAFSCFRILNKKIWEIILRRFYMLTQRWEILHRYSEMGDSASLPRDGRFYNFIQRWETLHPYSLDVILFSFLPLTMGVWAGRSGWQKGVAGNKFASLPHASLDAHRVKTRMSPTGPYTRKC